ncbi:MAG: hypothetical protein RPU52_02435 [Candidatus Sedimenticola sp. (ex Thyasira tokunagai)]
MKIKAEPWIMQDLAWKGCYRRPRIEKRPSLLSRAWSAAIRLGAFLNQKTEW